MYVIIWRKYCYVFTFLETFKYEFVNCKQGKNKYLFLFLFIAGTSLYATVSNLYNKPRLFCSHATSHKADWILTNGSQH